jgi:hypothetical protein
VTALPKAQVRIKWQGPPSGIKTRLGRGSASGSNTYGNPWHKMAGYGTGMRPMSVCGLTFQGVVTGPTKTMRGDEPRCPKCWGN